MDVRRVVEYLVVSGIVERKDSEVSISSERCGVEIAVCMHVPSFTTLAVLLIRFYRLANLVTILLFDTAISVV